jgi:hypothetical protein
MFVGAGMDATVITGSAYVPYLPGPVTIYDVATVGKSHILFLLPS